ncbi:hypothetical protein IX38_11690 [Chryseobacterium luteum]|uniref:Uncharacterized protein n=2 Tax=Chryseobacterium luteum TaxID=421531 RepID=A0A085ZGQ7_9FLAO|nr:hypothetical protein IX38_11690 [Chryseobacterium luteum]
MSLEKTFPVNRKMQVFIFNHHISCAFKLWTYFVACILFQPFCMKEKFKVMESKINRPLMYLAGSLIWLVIISVAVVIFFIFREISGSGFMNNMEYRALHFFILIFAEACLVLCCLFLIYLMVNFKKKYFRRIIVDEKGVSVYNIRNEMIHQTLYADLHHSNDVYLPDISHRIHSQPSFRITLRIFKKDKTGQIKEESIDLDNNSFSIKNKFELYRHFLNGIQTFRPELKIGQRTAEQYNLESHLTENKKISE